MIAARRAIALALLPLLLVAFFATGGARLPSPRPAGPELAIRPAAAAARTASPRTPHEAPRWSPAANLAEHATHSAWTTPAQARAGPGRAKSLRARLRFSWVPPASAWGLSTGWSPGLDRLGASERVAVERRNHSRRDPPELGCPPTDDALCRVVLVVHDPRCWMEGLPPAWVGQTRRLSGQRLDARTTREAVLLRLPPEHQVRALATIRGLGPVAQAWSAETTPDGVLVLVDCQGCRFCETARQAGLVVLGPYGGDRAGMRWQVWSTSAEALRDFLIRLEAAGCHGVLAKRCGPMATNGITPRQQEVLRAAMESGFFEQPRRTTLAQLAAQLQVSRSVASRTIRRAMKSVLHLL